MIASYLAPILLARGPATASGRLRKWWLLCASFIVRRSGLFDRDYYEQQNHDVAESGMDPLWHYLAYGDREGRQPMPWFDPEHYRRSLPAPISHQYNSLLHYLFIGRFLQPEVSPNFDTRHFYQNHRDVRLKRKESLLWFRQLGNAAASHYSPFALAAGTHLPEAPSREDWTRLPAMQGAAPLVDIIVPVFRGRAETLRCLYCVLSSEQQTPFRLIVVNDSSPDKELAAELSRLAERGLFDLVEHADNKGFVFSVNQALLLHPDRDVILLNADTEPHNDWLDRLRATAYRHPRVATVTPLSNNATIASYPRFDRDNPGPLELDPKEFDRLAAETNRGICVQAPTGVGFCLYIRRLALREVGPLDEASFGKGYGEENDFCRRAVKLGWENRITADVYIWHWGARSFLGEKNKHVSRAMQVMEQRHPGYRRLVEEFVSADGLAPHRAGLDRARLLRRRSSAENVLFVTHTRGGGAAKHVESEMRHLSNRGVGSFLLQPEKERFGRLGAPGLPRLPNLPPVDLTSAEQLEDLLGWLGISEIQIHQLVDFPRAITGGVRGAARTIAAAARRRGIPFDFYVHDYQHICPRINLVGPSSVYCGEPDERTCRRCLKIRVRGIENPNIADIHAWRVRQASLLEGARRVIVPDQDVMDRLSYYYPHAHYLVRPHEDPAIFPPSSASRSGRRGPVRIVVPGAISTVKGYDIVLAAARAAKRARLPLELIVMGYTRRDKELASVGVKITGRYWDENAGDTLREIDADMAWVPSVWPETYCYALSIPLKAGLPVAAFDLGAQASRLRRHGGDHLLLSIEFARKPQELIAVLHQFASARRRPCQKLAA